MNLPKLSTKMSSYKRDDFSKITHEFCQQTSFVKKQVQITSQNIQTDIQVFISDLAPLSQNSKREDFMQGYFFFF